MSSKKTDTEVEQGDNEGNGTADLDATAQNVENAAKVLALLDSKNSEASQEEEEDIKTPAQVMGSTTRKKAPRKRPPAPPTVSAKVKKMIGDAERYRFYKVDMLGTQSLIKDYCDQDIAIVNYDLELFIQQYLVKQYGEGQYVVKILNGKGMEVGMKMYSVLAPNTATIGSPQSGGAVFEQGLVTQQTKRLQELQDQLLDQEKNDRQRLKDEKEKLEEAMKELRSGGDSNGMMMMMMMQDRQRQAQADSDRRSAEIRREQNELQLKLAALSAPPLPPPPPPAPSAPDPLAQIATLLKLFREMTPTPTADPMAEFWKQRALDMEKNQSQPMGIEDMFGKMEKMDELFARRYGQPDGGGKEMVKGFLDNFAENMGAIKDVITAAPAQAAATDKPAQLQAPQEESDPLPDGFLEIIMELDDADEDLDRINTMLQVLKLFANSGVKKYEMLSKQVIENIGKNNPRPVMFVLSKVLEECVDRDMITDDTKAKTYRAFTKHFEVIHRNVAGLPQQDEQGSEATSSSDAAPPEAHDPDQGAVEGQSPSTEGQSPSSEGPSMAHAVEVADTPALVQGPGA